MESVRTFPKIDISPDVYFLGTDAEIEDAERLEAERAEEFGRLFFSPSFVACEYVKESGARRILHRSTRPGVMFQLSFIAPDGVPTMHQNYIKTGSDAVPEAIHTGSDLLQFFASENIGEIISLRILTK